MMKPFETAAQLDVWEVLTPIQGDFSFLLRPRGTRVMIGVTCVLHNGKLGALQAAFRIETPTLVRVMDLMQEGRVN